MTRRPPSSWSVNERRAAGAGQALLILAIAVAGTDLAQGVRIDQWVNQKLDGEALLGMMRLTENVKIIDRGSCPVEGAGRGTRRADWPSRSMSLPRLENRAKGHVNRSELLFQREWRKSLCQPKYSTRRRSNFWLGCRRGSPISERISIQQWRPAGLVTEVTKGSSYVA